MFSLLFITLSGIFNAVMDSIYFRWNTCIFSKIDNEKFQQFCNPKLSWVNKWKDGDYTKGERFFGSSTIFVFITDLWHLCQFLMILSYIIAIVLYIPIISPIIDVIILYVMYSCTFELFFKKVFIQKK